MESELYLIDSNISVVEQTRFIAEGRVGHYSVFEEDDILPIPVGEFFLVARSDEIDVSLA
ncbi:hypothetical protein OUZ56_005147 [Daphnia magna]|uniref:Uncharacterized protein n=1 Tax=Daphnia magna TaxID=35525 RepID=A0ABQ9YS08_9CRUS|nr:hypothetical protein OUZ56_005147 [Daphnia magna]